MRLFHRTSQEDATAVLRDGFEDEADPSGDNYGFFDEIPPINAVWFGSVPLDANEGSNVDGASGDVLFLIEIPD